MKSIILEGQVEQAPCESCQRFVDATYSYGPIEIDGASIIEDVMRATCPRCGSVVATAPQSVHRFQAAREDRASHRTTIRISQELQDFISLNLSAAGADTTHVELYFRALLLACRTREDQVGGKLAAVRDAVLQCPNRVTVNLTLGPHLSEILERLRATSGIRNVSEMMRRLLVLADGDLEGAALEEVQRLAYAYS